MICEALNLVGNHAFYVTRNGICKSNAKILFKQTKHIGVFQISRSDGYVGSDRLEKKRVNDTLIFEWTINSIFIEVSLSRMLHVILGLGLRLPTMWE